MYEALLKNTPEYQKTAASLASPGPAALFGLPPAGRALLYAALQKDTGRILCVVTPGEAEATHFADDLKTLGLSAAVFPPRDFMLRPVEGAGREYEYRRLSVLGALAGGRLNAVCVPAEALLQYTVPQNEFQKNTLTLNPAWSTTAKRWWSGSLPPDTCGEVRWTARDSSASGATSWTSTPPICVSPPVWSTGTTR